MVRGQGLGLIDDGLVACRDGLIVYAGAATGAPGLDALEILDCEGRWITPGLIDCHTHLVGEPDSGRGYAELLARTGAQEALSGARNARDTLMAGASGVGFAAVAVGFVVSFVVAIVVVRAFVGYISRHGFAPFAWYRIAAGIVALAWLSMR